MALLRRRIPHLQNSCCQTGRLTTESMLPSLEVVLNIHVYQAEKHMNITKFGDFHLEVYTLIAFLK